MKMLSVIIPAYNEEENIKRIESELVPVMKKIGERYEIIVVDDGSTDETVNEIIKMQKKHKEILLVKHGKNKGLGIASLFIRFIDNA